MDSTYTLMIGGIEVTFDTKAQYEKYKTLLSNFISETDLPPPHTNLEPSVLLSKDNPILNEASIVSSGILVPIKSISDKEWKEKYEGQGSGFTNKVPAINPKPQIKAHPKAVKEKLPPVEKTWVGAPYTDEEMQPQNLRYTFPYNPSSSVSNCPTCVGLPGMTVHVTYCNGTPAGQFPCAIWNGAMPTVALIGTTVKCDVDPSSPYYHTCSACTPGPWLVTDVTGPCNVNYGQCESLVPDVPCAGSPPCATPHQVSVSPPSSPSGCEVAQIYFKDGTSGWSASRGVFLTYDSVGSPGVGITLMDEQSLFNLVTAALPTYGYAQCNGTVSGSVAKVGNKIYNWAALEPPGQGSRACLLELEINASLTSVSVTNIYTRVGSPLSALAGNSLCAKNSNTLLTYWGNNGTMEEIVMDPVTNSFTNNTLFTTVAPAAGDVIYDPGTDTIWHAEYDQGTPSIRHYDMNGTVLGNVPTQGQVWRMWCQAGEIIFYMALGGTCQVDKTNYTYISLFIPFPLMTTQPGDAASSPDCCISIPGGGSNCATPHQI